MQQRIEAMIFARRTVRPPLEKFYGLLNDEQKARLNALAEDQRKASVAAMRGRIQNQVRKLSNRSGCGAAQPAAFHGRPARSKPSYTRTTPNAPRSKCFRTPRPGRRMLKATCPRTTW